MAKDRVLHSKTKLMCFGHLRCHRHLRKKLMGEIPGAYTQAFNFAELMEKDMESDDEVELL